MNSHRLEEIKEELRIKIVRTNINNLKPHADGATSMVRSKEDKEFFIEGEMKV